MPLHEIRAAHEGAVFAGASVIVPEIEVGEVDGMREGRSGQCAVLVQTIHDVFGCENLFVGASNDLFCLRIDAVNGGLSVALRADLLHVDLRLEIVGPMGADGVGKIPTEPVGRIVRDLESVDAAHMAGGAGGHKHIARRECARIGIELEQVALGGEHHAVLGLVVDLHLRVVWAHVALAAGSGQSRKSDRTGVARMAFGATADGAVVIWLADGVALLAAGGDGGVSFGQRERVGRTLGASGLELLAEGDLLSAQALLAMDGGPTGCGVTAAQELLVDAFVAGAAVARREMGADHEAVVIDLLLIRSRLVAVQAIHALFRMGGHLVFMHHGILKSCMALRALARCPDEVGSGLLSFDLGPGAIDEKCRQYQRERNDDSQKHRTKRHRVAPGRCGCEERIGEENSIHNTEHCNCNRPACRSAQIRNLRLRSVPKPSSIPNIKS